MKRQLIIKTCGLILVLFSPATFAKATTMAEYVPGELLIKYKDSASSLAAISRLNSSLGVSKQRAFKSVRIEHVRLPTNMRVEEAIEYYKQDSNVEYAEPNYIVHASAGPDDPDLIALWGLNNTGQTVNGIVGIEDADIDAPEAWEIETGVDHPVVIAVVDTGVAYHHPDLEANIWRNTAENCENGIDDDGNGYVDDCYGWDFIGNDNEPTDYNNYQGGIGHGSHVAGTIAAVGNNGIGITGVMWQAQIMPLRILGVTGAGTTAAAIAAIEYANANGAQVINNSWGGIGFSQALKDVIDQSNAVIVCAAGNESQDNDLNPTYPASFTSPNIISVAATTSNDVLAFFSNYGRTSVDVAAPGVFTFSTMPVYTLGASERVYRENFDEPDASLERLGWITGERSSLSSPSTWEVAPNRGRKGNSLEDSPDGDYKNYTDSWAGYTNSGIPLRSKKDNLYTLEFQWKGALEQDRDFLEINASIDGVSWDPIDRRSGTVSKFTKDFSTELTFVADIVDEFYFGFGLSSDAVNTDNGVFINKVELLRTPITLSGSSYDYKIGTSMATPHVSGTAGLLKAFDPSLTKLEIKAAILQSVDPLVSLENKIVSGGRVNAHKALLAIPQKTQ